MGRFKIAVLAVFSLVFTSVAHKYYVSVTQIEYVETSKTLQVIARIDAEDLELILQERYDKSIQLTGLNEKPSVDDFIEKYLNKKLNIKINDKNLNFEFVGKKYDNDQVVCYLEANNIDNVKNIEVTNTVLFDKFTEQKNVIKIIINSERYNLICTNSNQTENLNF